MSKELDQYYTDTRISNYFYNVLKNKIDLSKYTLFLEPSAGMGSFYNLLPEQSRIGLDIDPRHPEIVTQDFLSYIPNFLDENILTIGNPPFGKNSSLATKFFNKSAEFSEIIAFILPKTFRKASIQNRLNPHFHLIYDEECPKNSFIYLDKLYDVPCCFQIWQREKYLRPKIQIFRKHEDFELVAKDQNPDFAVQRIGNNAGLFRPKELMMKYSDQSHYFIKSKIPSALSEKIFKSIDFTLVKYNTAGNPSVSPSELYQLYEKHKQILSRE